METEREHWTFQTDIVCKPNTRERSMLYETGREAFNCFCFFHGARVWLGSRKTGSQSSVGGFVMCSMCRRLLLTGKRFLRLLITIARGCLITRETLRVGRQKGGKRN